MLNGKQINLIVAASNIFGIIPIYYSNNFYEKVWVWTIILASILMHLSERKHRLPGVYPFNLFTKQFLWFDRIMALSPFMLFGGLISVIFLRTISWNL